MTMSRGHGRRRGWRLAIATAAVVAVIGGLYLSPRAPVPQPRPPTPTRRRVPTGSTTRRRKLVDCVTQGDLWAYMVKFQQIADANPGADGHPSRNSGEPGYKASADYVADVMRAAGYTVTLQEYKFHYFSFVGDPVLREDVADAAISFARDGFHLLGSPVRDARSSTRGRHRRAGDADPELGQRLPGLRLRRVHPGQHRPHSAGHLHLRPEGGNAEATGASAAVIFNEGNPGRTGVSTAACQVKRTSPSSSRPTP